MDLAVRVLWRLCSQIITFQFLGARVFVRGELPVLSLVAHLPEVLPAGPLVAHLLLGLLGDETGFGASLRAPVCLGVYLEPLETFLSRFGIGVWMSFK